MVSLAIIGIAMDIVHRKARPILKEEGFELIFFIRYSDIRRFLDDENITEVKKKEIRKLFKRLIYLAISGGIIFIATIIVARFFPSLAMF